MTNLRAFYAKTTELKNQFKLDFTFDSIDLIGHEIEQTFHFSKSNKDPQKQSKIYGLFIKKCGICISLAVKAVCLSLRVA